MELFQNKTRLKKNVKGFALIEVLIFLFIFTVAVLAFYQAFNVGMNYAIETKKKLGAVGLANEEIEKMRNLGYENLPESSTEDVEMEKNGMTYYVTTHANDFDEREEGTGDDDENELSSDYKKINVSVYWELN